MLIISLQTIWFAPKWQETLLYVRYSINNKYHKFKFRKSRKSQARSVSFLLATEVLKCKRYIIKDACPRAFCLPESLYCLAKCWPRTCLLQPVCNLVPWVITGTNKTRTNMVWLGLIPFPDLESLDCPSRLPLACRRPCLAKLSRPSESSKKPSPRVPFMTIWLYCPSLSTLPRAFTKRPFSERH